jgi:hypothetical protein
MHFLPSLTLAAAATVLVAACGGGDTEDRLNVRDPVVRFLNAAPAAGNLTLFRNEEVQGDTTNSAYKAVSRYFDVSSSVATWSVRSSATSTTPLASVEVNPARGHRYTFVGLQGTTPSTVDLVGIDDPYNKGLTSDRGRVRALHAVPGGGAVDVYLMQPAQDLAATAPTFGGLGYKTALPASGEDSAEVPGGSYRLVLTAAGTKTVLFNAPVVSIANNADWLLVAIPGPSGTPTGMRVLVAQGNDVENGTTQELVSQ